MGSLDEVKDDDFDLTAALEEAAFVLPGDVWTLCQHRLICGDATDAATVKRLMDGHKANLVLTDPPYGVSFRNTDGLTIKNDNLKDEHFYSFLLSSFNNLADSLESGGSAYIFHADTEGENFRRVFCEAGFHLSVTCIWVKDSFVMGRSPYHCANDRKQSAIVLDVARDMCRLAPPALQRRVKLLDSTKRIIYHPTRSYYQALSSEVSTKFGLNIHATVFDELLGQKDRELYDVMTKGAGAARRQPLNFVITTVSSDTNSICYEVYAKALDILQGRKSDPTFYPVVFSTPEDADWTDPKVWKMSNPSLGVTVKEEYLRSMCESAKQNPAEENHFRQFHLNQPVKQSVRWMPMAKWDACAFPVDAASLEGRLCYGGLDLSSTTDITAFVLVFPPEDEDGKYSVLPSFWMPENNIGLRVQRDHVQYDLWEKQGHLLTTEGNVVHYGYIERFIEELGERYNIREIAFDRWGAVQMVQNLEGLGFTVVPFGQGFKDMSPPTKSFSA